MSNNNFSINQAWPIFVHANQGSDQQKESDMAYLEITLKIAEQNRAAAAGVYKKYKAPFLDSIAGAKSKELLLRAEDVQVLHGFETADQASAYIGSQLFNGDVVAALKPFLQAAPEVRIYQVV
jgi:hypothetical protein